VATVSARLLPEAVRTTLSEFTAAAQGAIAADLLSVVLFGSAAEGRPRATSDVNVALVLRRVDPKNPRPSASHTGNRRHGYTRRRDRTGDATCGAEVARLTLRFAQVPTPI
jgi:hypothetical protein